MKRHLLLCAVVASAFAVAGSSVHADTLKHGFNSGSGNPQDFVVQNIFGGIEVGLAAQPRYSGPAVTKSGDTYFVQPGTNGGKAVWNFDFSIDTNPNDSATPQYNLNGLYAELDILGPGGHIAAYFPLLQNPGDNAPSGSTTLAQNSENMTFGIFGGAPYKSTLSWYNPDAPGTYGYTLSIYNSAITVPLGSVHMNVTVVPLPSAAWGGFALLGGLGLVVGAKRLRRQTV